MEGFQPGRKEYIWLKNGIREKQKEKIGAWDAGTGRSSVGRRRGRCEQIEESVDGQVLK